MTLPAVLYTLSSVPIFASRPFLAAFVTALLARFGTELPWIGDNAVVVALAASPDWFRGPTCLTVLGLLALLEVLSANWTEAREVLDRVDGIVKAVVAVFVTLALIDADTAKTVDAIRQGGITLEKAWTFGIAAATWSVAALRRRVVELVHEADDGDDVGLVSLLAWVENAWAVLGILFLVVAPIAALVLAAFATFGLWWARKRAEERERRSLVPCASCATPLRPHAMRCHVCQRELDAPRAVGVFGQPKEHAASDRARHAFDLVSRKRCPVCATHLPKRAVSQACPTCGKVTFASRAEFERYLDVIAARLPRTLLVTCALGAIPLVGVIPGVVYYRLNLVTGLRGYVPPLRGCTTRWVVRLIHVLVIALQPIPIAGAFLLPLLGWSTYAIYRRSLAARAREDLAVATVAATQV